MERDWRLEFFSHFFPLHFLCLWGEKGEKYEPLSLHLPFTKIREVWKQSENQNLGLKNQQNYLHYLVSNIFGRNMCYLAGENFALFHLFVRSVH